MFWFPSKKNEPGLSLFFWHIIFFTDVIATVVKRWGLISESDIQQLGITSLNTEVQNFNVNVCWRPVVLGSMLLNLESITWNIHKEANGEENGPRQRQVQVLVPTDLK